MHVSFAFGETRFVVLVGKFAFKIGRFRPLRCLCRMLILPFSKRRRDHFTLKYGPHIMRAIQNDIIAGLIANRNEFSFWEWSQNSKNAVPVIPTIRLYMCGWVVIQARGQPITHATLQNEGPVLDSAFGEDDCEVNDPHQFCLYEGKVVLVDYARPSTQKSLRTFIAVSTT